MNTWAKIMGAYVLSHRNIARIIAAIAAAILTFHTAITTLSPADEALKHRTSDAMCRILNIEESLPATESRIAVSDHVFGELSELFVTFRHLLPGASAPTMPRLSRLNGSIASSQRPATKADLWAAVKTILRGEDVNLSKPGPHLTHAKRRQIAAAENYRKTHCGCTLHNACLRSFTAIPGGYASGKSLYRVMKRMNS